MIDVRVQVRSLSVPGHEILYVGGMVGDAVLSEETAAVVGDEHVVLYADAAEVLVFFKQIEIEELGAVAGGAPAVDECGNEIYARLVGNDKAFFELAAHAQAVCSELLQNWTRLVVEAHINLAEALHIVNVKAHHVAEAVRQEHGVGAGAYGFFGIASHQSEFLETIGHKTADIEMDVHISYAGASNVEHTVVAFLDNAVYIKLTLGEAAAYRERAGVVAAIAIHVLGAGVAQGEASLLQQCHRRIAVHYLAVLREYRGEAHFQSVAVGDAVHLAAYEFLGNTGAGEAHVCMR